MIDALPMTTRSSPQWPLPRCPISSFDDAFSADVGASTAQLTIASLLATESPSTAAQRPRGTYRRIGKPDDMAVLVAAMALRDEKALHALHRACESRMRLCALSIVKRPEEAEEVVSSSFIQAWQDASRFDGTRGPVIAWLLTITRSRSLDALRRDACRATHERPSGEDFDEAFQSDWAEPDVRLEVHQRKVALQQLLKTLTRAQQEAIGLAFMHGMTHDEVARHTGRALGTTKSHIDRGLAILRDRCTALALSA